MPRVRLRSYTDRRPRGIALPGPIDWQLGRGLRNVQPVLFAPLGAVERRKGLLGTTHDENAVRFRRNQSAVVEDIRRYIEAHLGAPTPAPDVADQLRKFGELRDSRFLTSAEFEAKKKELLGRL